MKEHQLTDEEIEAVIKLARKSKTSVDNAIADAAAAEKIVTYLAGFECPECSTGDFVHLIVSRRVWEAV